MTTAATNAVATLTGHLEQSSADSKKWRMTKYGLFGVGAMTLIGSAVIFLKPEAGQHIVGLMTVSIGTWTAITSVYVGAQAAVENKTTAGIASLASPPPPAQNIVNQPGAVA